MAEILEYIEKLKQRIDKELNPNMDFEIRSSLEKLRDKVDILHRNLLHSNTEDKRLRKEFIDIANSEDYSNEKISILGINWVAYNDTLLLQNLQLTETLAKAVYELIEAMNTLKTFEKVEEEQAEKREANPTLMNEFLEKPFEGI